MVCATVRRRLPANCGRQRERTWAFLLTLPILLLKNEAEPYSPTFGEQDPAQPRPDRPRIAAVGTPACDPFLMFDLAPKRAVCT